MGNLNCSHLTNDTQNEIKSADFNRNKTYISKNHILKISFPIRNMKKSKTSSPKSHLSLKEKTLIIPENNKNKETKNNEKIFRRSFTPRRRKQFKISPEISTSNKKEENKKLDFKNKKSKEKDNKDNEDNDINKKGVKLKKGKSSPLEVICEQIEDEKKVLDTTRTFKNKDKNINDKNNNSIINNNIKNTDKTAKDLIFNDSNEKNDNNSKILNNSNFYSNKSGDTENNINENNNKDDSLIKKKKIDLYFNHTGSSKGEEDCKQDENNNYYNYNEIAKDNVFYNNDNNNNNNNDNNNNDDNNDDNYEDKEYKRKINIKEKYKDLYKKRYSKNKYYKELNWRNIKIDKLLFSKKEKDILLQGEFLVLEINSSIKSKYLRYLTLAKHEMNIFRSKEKDIYYKSPLINIPLFNISKCDLLNKNDINMSINLKDLLLKYSFFIKLITVTGMIIF